MNRAQVAKFLAQAGVEYAALKRPQNTFVAVLTFTDVAQREAAHGALQGMACKGRELRCTVAAAQDWGSRQQQHQREREQRGGGEGGEGKRQRQRGEGEGGGKQQQEKTLAEVVTPLGHMPYAEQLAKKEGEMRTGCVQKMFRGLKAAYHDKRKLLVKAHEKGEAAVRACVGAWCACVRRGRNGGGAGVVA
jgi:hypothetical protein